MRQIYKSTFANLQNSITFLLLMCLCCFHVNAQDTLTIGNATSSNYRYPVNRSVNYSASEILFTKTDLGKKGLISQISFYQTSGNGGTIYPCNVYMKMTGDSTISQTSHVGYTQVWRGILQASGGTGWKSINLQLPFNYSDTLKNLSVIIVSGGQTATNNFPSYANTPGNIGKSAYYASNTAPWTDGMAMTVVNNRPNVRMIIQPAVPCSGSPLPGNTVATADLICPGSDVTLSTANVQYVTGLTYQWQTATDSITWSNVSGATAPFYSGTPATAIYYRTKVSCGNDSAISVAKKVAPSFLACYCASVMDCSSSDVITQVSVSNNQPNYTGTVCAPNGNGYTLNRTSNPVLYIGNNQTISVSTDGDTEGVGAWIDFNQDGIFSNEEKILSNYSTSVPYVHTGSFTIPTLTMSGSTMLRVITQYGAIPTNPCADAGNYGETEDYLVTISSTPLVLKMGDIAATNIGNSNKVSWNTLQEEKGTTYTIEKSADGRTFKTLATVSGKGMPSDYQYWDAEPNEGVTYYRLHAEEPSSAKGYYSKTVQATWEKTNTFGLHVFPNPATNQVTISLYGTPDAAQVVVLMDATGRVLYEAQMEGAKLTLDVSKYVSGVYLLQYKSATHQQSARIIKQ